MRIPDKNALGAGLRKWREYHKWTVKDVEGRSEKRSKKKFKANLVYKWEAGWLAPSYERLVEDIFPAYEIDDLYKVVVFLAGFCQHKPGIESVKLIKQVDLSHDNQLGVSILFAEEERVRPHLVRIDQVTVKHEMPSEITAHPGYNYLLVTQGRLQCSFWPSDGKRKDKGYAPRKFELKKGDAIAFPTEVPHKIESMRGPARVVVARPPWGKPEVVKQP